ncbi:MAG: phenylalanine--tRNA ligase subunit alpha [Candidatus Moranbacteria bacterium RIFOXYA12_FULL_44_15]|nr:MAG: phenylalanine--tRNA ligase subunit alpha [Candidatus Moranbacteria bacterium RIFOXYA12_FULL_44_15]OGI34944.1 MAG: phenylalanine--tRNA ligase subunit alpha [Candidatus Moranbacteria bacterium RIFOXYA2_FULL_43_15]
MEQKINDIKKQVAQAISKIKNSQELFDLEKRFLGRKSEFTDILKGLKDLSQEDRKKIGELANRTKNEIAGIILSKKQELSGAVDLGKEKIDVTLPGYRKGIGHLNPITTVQNEIMDIFTSMGFEVADGPEVETEFYNFDALNIPADHPARDMQDTFWLKQKSGEEGLVLRTHTSNVQIRYMSAHKPPFRIIAPGKTFRHEATDAKHEHTFYQFEALVVDKNISVANFKFIAKTFFEKFFGRELNIRLRPSFFPFTEPSFEFDISCAICGGKGCSTCGHSGWLEIGGAGMVNQKVFEAVGYKRNEYQGFAWGFGIPRLAMLKYKIDDNRHFHSGDLRFVKQF